MELKWVKCGLINLVAGSKIIAKCCCKIDIILILLLKNGMAFKSTQTNVKSCAELDGNRLWN